jgi:hypothetical protein
MARSKLDVLFDSAMVEAKGVSAENFVSSFFKRYPRMVSLAPSLEKIKSKEKQSGQRDHEATQRLGEIWLLPKFWELEDEIKDFVFAHEIGHYVLSEGISEPLWLVEALKLQGIDAWDASSLPFGQFNMDEAFADSFATYFIDETELKRRYPGWHTVVRQGVARTTK